MYQTKRLMAVLLAIFCVFGLFGCSEKAAPDEDAVQISFWIPKGEDSSYYSSYDENPVIKFFETGTYNGQKVDLTFFVPVAGAERDNFNTLLATEEYADVMDMSQSTVSAAELLEDGIIYDLTDYIDQYMPNYKAILDANPDIAAQTYSIVNGEKRALGIYAINEEVLSNFKGFLYRRDWLAKYGTNPETGAAFTYGYADPADKESWYDDVVFPSGGSDPVYISDWEWMFGVFEKAMAEQGITDGYCMSLYFKGFNEDGALYNSFGGGAPMWYRNQNNEAAFDGDSESMRTYLECMNNWWNKGWLDREFTERTGDAVYSIDTAGVATGKVGLWIGRRSQTGSQLDNGEGFADGMMVYGARCPINDVYGSDAVKGKEPYSIYQYSRLQGQVTVTTKVTQEELPTVLSFLDYLYSLEGACAQTLGLTKEQNDILQDENYARFGLTEGAYYVEKNEDGSNKYVVVDALVEDNDLCQAMAAKRLTLGYKADGFIPALNASYTEITRKAINEWDYYLNTGYLMGSERAQFTTDESSAYSKVHANIDTFMAINIPKFIKGDLDVHNDEDWDDYCTMINKYGPNKVSKIYQRIFDITG